VYNVSRHLVFINGGSICHVNFSSNMVLCPFGGLLNLESAPCFVNFPLDCCRKPLTWLSVHANNGRVPQIIIDGDPSRKDTW
jgi:hypothetical protein